MRYAIACVLVGPLVIYTAPLIAAGETRNVLILHSSTRLLPQNVITDRALGEALDRPGKPRVEVFIEYLDVPRFSGERYVRTVATYLREKYSSRPPEALVASGDIALAFLIKNRAHLFPETPVVALGATSVQTPGPLPADVVGSPLQLDTLRTIELAFRLHPNATHLVLVTGTSEWDRSWEARLRSEVSRFPDRATPEFLAGLTTEALRKRLAELGPDAVVFTPGYFADGDGKVVTPRAAAQIIAAAASAPVYGPYDTFIDTGVVGGYMPSSLAAGQQAGQIVNALLDGAALASLRGREATVPAFNVDWRQVRRWGIHEGLLPLGTVVRFREPSAWDKYRREISIGIAIVALQTALIVALLFERRLRRRTAVALDDSEERLKFAARAAGLSMWTWDTTRDRVRSTTPSRQPARLPKEQSIDSGDFLERVHPGDREVVERAARQALAKGDELDIQYRLVQPDGEVRWIAARGRAQKKSDRLLGVAHDITGRRLAELQAERDRTALRHMTRVSLLGQLSASIAHQLNQPLAAILGNAEAAHKMLARKQVDLAELREICEDIVTEDHRAVEVIRRLGALYRRGELQLQPLDLNELVRETLELVRTELLTRHVIPITELAPLLPVIDGDRVQLQQVLLNLIVNAADAMGETAEEERTLTIRTDLTGGDVRVCVTDRGLGIAAEDLEHLFEPFWSGKPEGVGIGLAICRSIVAAHRGSLTAANNPGGGATFCATVPVRKQA